MSQVKFPLKALYCFKIGDIVRYGNGKSALMKITHVSTKHNGLTDRYYGVDCYGNTIGVYSCDLSPLGVGDRQTWYDASFEHSPIEHKTCHECGYAAKSSDEVEVHTWMCQPRLFVRDFEIRYDVPIDNPKITLFINGVKASESLTQVVIEYCLDHKRNPSLKEIQDLCEIYGYL